MLLEIHLNGWLGWLRRAESEELLRGLYRVASWAFWELLSPRSP